MAASLKTAEETGFNPFQNLPPLKEKLEFIDWEKADVSTKESFEKELEDFEQKWKDAQEKYGKNVTVNFDNQPDIESSSSITDAGTYVIRNGKLV